MSTLLIAMLAVAADPQAATSETQASAKSQSPGKVAKDAPQRSPRALGEALSAALKAESHAPPEKRHEAARELVALYHEVSANRRIAKSLRKKWRVRLRIRLQRIRKRLKREAAIAAKKNKKPASVRPRDVKPRDVKPRDGDRDVLAQQGPFGQGPGGGNQGNGPGGAAKDHGQDLIDVITTTIMPDSWEENGGNGTIIYYRPLNALIIRQRAEVHENIGGVIQQLRRAQ